MNEKVNRDEKCDEMWRKYQHSPTGKILAGIWVVIIGAVLLTKQLGFEYPTWLFTWPVMLIAVGIYIGARHLFCNAGWFIMVAVGSLFLWDQMSPDMDLSIYIWPILIILVGIVMIFKPQRRHRFSHHRYHHRRHWHYNAPQDTNTASEEDKTSQEHTAFDWRERKQQEESNREDYIETVSIFSGVRKNVVSKTFKGGEITCVLGGAEVNFMQADIQGRVVLEVTQVLGGAKLLIPSNWDVQPEMIAILGGIEDKRQVNNNISPDKILVIRGTCVLGGIEIKSF
jgi:predicted membrane protein